MIFVFLALCLFGSVKTRIQLPNSCPPAPSATSLDVAKFTGTWFVTLMQLDLSHKRHCAPPVTVDHSLKNNYTLDVHVYNATKIGNEMFDVSGVHRVNASDPGKLFIQWSNISNDKEIENLVLETDYNRFVVVYHCYHFEFFYLQHVQTLMIYTKNRHIEPDVEQEILKVLERKKIVEPEHAKEPLCSLTDLK